MKLGDVCKVSSSKRIFAHEYKDSGIPFYRGQEISELARGNKNINCKFISVDRFNELKSKYYIPKQNDILITAVGTIGNLYLIENNEPFYFKDGNLILLSEFDIKLAIPQFIYLYLSMGSIKNKLISLANNSIQKALTIDMLQNFDIELPSIEIQYSLVKNVFPILNKIRNNNLKIDVLTNKIKDIFTYWFKDFQYPNSSNKGYRNDNGEFKTTDDNNEIPLNWEYTALNKSSLAVQIKTGISKFDDSKLYFSTSEVVGNNYSMDGNIITYDNRESRANMQPLPYSVWFAKMKNSIKHISFGKDSPLTDKVILSTGFFGLNCNEITYPYVWSCVFVDDSFELKKDYIATGSTQEAINDINFCFMKFPIPDIDTLKKYSTVVLPLINLIEKLNTENEVLVKLKKTILVKSAF